MNDLNTEVGSNQNNLNSTILRSLANKTTPGSTISFSDFYSKTGKMTGNISTSASGNSNGGISGKGFMGGTLDEFIRNISTGQFELHFTFQPTNWTGNITVTNNTTGASSVLSRINSINWGGTDTANLRRNSSNDFFTIIPS